MKMYRVSYEVNGTINHRSFNTEAEATEWIKNNANIKALKLLVWDNEIDCYSTVKIYNKVSKNASAIQLFKRVYA